MTAWDDLKSAAVAALAASTFPRQWVHDYRRIPEGVSRAYSVGLVDHHAVLALPECPPERRDQFGKLPPREWVAFFLEDLEGRPLGVELRATRDKDHMKVYFAGAAVHPPLFGLAQALPILAERGEVALVEGGFEVLAFAAVSRYPVLGVMTKNPSRNQQRFLARWAPTVVRLFLNSDEEGRRTARRVADQWREPRAADSRWWEAPGVGVLSGVKDLNELLQQQGPAGLRLALSHGLRR